VLKTLSRLFFILVIVGLSLGFFRAIVCPRENNYYENRVAYQMPTVSFDKFLDGNLQDEAENALTDQFPLSSYFKKAYHFANDKFIELFLLPLMERFPEESFKYEGKFFRDGYIAHQLIHADRISEYIEINAENYAQVVSALPDKEVYIYMIETDADCSVATGEKSGIWEYFLSVTDIPESNLARFEIDSFETYSKYFFKTDHHWDYAGSYVAYTQLVSILCSEQDPLIPLDTLSAGQFYGTKSAACGMPGYTEEFTAYTFDFPYMEITINGEPAADYGRQAEFLSGEAQDGVSYGKFYGADNGETIFRTNCPEKEDLLIVGESYDNALLKLIASHFNNTYSIDMRSYPYDGSAFNITEYVALHNVDKVLIIGSSSSLFASIENLMET